MERSVPSYGGAIRLILAQISFGFFCIPLDQTTLLANQGRARFVEPIHIEECAARFVEESLLLLEKFSLAMRASDTYPGRRIASWFKAFAEGFRPRLQGASKIFHRCAVVPNDLESALKLILSLGMQHKFRHPGIARDTEYGGSDDPLGPYRPGNTYGCAQGLPRRPAAAPPCWHRTAKLRRRATLPNIDPWW